MNYLKENQQIFRSPSGADDCPEHDGRVATEGLACGIRRAAAAVIAACASALTFAAGRHGPALGEGQPATRWTTSS